MNAVVFIPLTQGHVAVIDFADYHRVRGYKWYAKRYKQRVYPARNVRLADKRVTRFIHQYLMPDAHKVDHRDGDGLNNRRHNLRPATQQQNQRGFRKKVDGATSGFRGVSWKPVEKKWRAVIYVSRRQHFLGNFSSEVEAARAYDAAARVYFGEFASPNFS